MTCYRKTGRSSELPKGSSGCEAIQEVADAPGTTKQSSCREARVPNKDLASWQAGSIPATHTEEQSRHAEVP